MIETWILIIVLGAYSSQSGITTIQQEFSSFDRCEKAREAIIKNRAKDNYAHVVSQGCYKK